MAPNLPVFVLQDKHFLGMGFAHTRDFPGVGGLC